jgi:hypothetical protein
MTHDPEQSAGSAIEEAKCHLSLSLSQGLEQGLQYSKINVYLLMAMCCQLRPFNKEVVYINRLYIPLPYNPPPTYLFLFHSLSQIPNLSWENNTQISRMKYTL